ncbi:hypothetical protein NC651_032809 [Populus alba x Populus x berolinensis]|nr:hypothetical protein NC651_032809 [Populus alba x Populus x berolinensis]
MEIDKIAELKSFLKVLPPVGFCCVYDSSLHPNNNDKSSMVDYIIGVLDPKQWHSEVDLYYLETYRVMSLLFNF